MTRDPHASNADSIVIEMVYPHPVSEVWAALTNPEALGVWLMPNDFEPRVGHRFTFHTTPDSNWNGIVNCEVVALDHQKRIAYTWKGNGLDTLVTFNIEPAEGGTRLRLEHAGFSKSGQMGYSVRDLLASGWNSRILRERLPALLAQRAHSALSDNENR